ncbi:nuclear transport factor 2 family protein [Flavobacterium sp.]|uniref:nuclear transport factor 2 family protein n=1 Tax=Flavobacterium sp. TaxID=239 RepID=UPI00260C111F|nr:nuclear transport factor 2 family protein [Flavobacterium sp.]
MTTQEIATRLFELTSTHQHELAYNELFSEDALNIEPPHAQGMQSVKGLAAIRAKSEGFNAGIEEVHSAYNHEPKVFGPYIFMEMGMDVTMKGMGRMDMREMCKYEVKDGKIISEEFYY